MTVDKTHSSIQFSDICLLVVIFFHIICCPYTKVEESFNMQAIHDLLEFRSDVDAYDHLQFPGVVPRTFIGAIAIAALSLPLYSLFSLLDMSGLHRQMLCRAVLGACVWHAFVRFRQGISRRFGARTAQLFLVLTMLQFHVCFYSSRTLPNVFALIVCLWSFGYWLSGDNLVSISCIAVAAVIFRCDMLVLLVPTVLLMLFSHEITFWRSFFVGLLVTLASLALTVGVDSFFWKKYLWPEGVVLFFNTVENKSSEWGVMPFHWYLTNAIPKSLNVTLFWVAVALLGIGYQSKHSDGLLRGFVSSVYFGKHSTAVRKAMHYCFPSFCFVVLYSFLPHKELRFILPALPMFTLLGAVGLNSALPHEYKSLWFPLSLLANCEPTPDHKKNDDSISDSSNKKKHATNGLYAFVISVGVLASFLVMGFLASTFLSASYHNYPGGVAVDRLLAQYVQMRFVAEDDLSTIDRPLFIHIDTLAATSGVTRFVQERFPLKNHAVRDHFFLNTSPTQWKELVAAKNCSNMDWGICSGDAVFYSKQEDLEDFAGFDWVITEKSNFHDLFGNFTKVETIFQFDRMGLHDGFPQVQLKPALYIFQNIADSDV